jgi:hypothetical protein
MVLRATLATRTYAFALSIRQFDGSAKVQLATLTSFPRQVMELSRFFVTGFVRRPAR